MSDFLARFDAARAGDNPQGLQLLYFALPALDAGAIAAMLNELPGVADVRCEFAAVADVPEAAKFVSDAGPPAVALGLVAFSTNIQPPGEPGASAPGVHFPTPGADAPGSPTHTVKLALFAAPMPYGPVESCVGPALLPPPMKVDAAQHKAHLLLYYAGTHPDATERFAALCAVAGALARFDAIVVLNEEARTAAPALDLIPDPGEDALHTYRSLPIPYLLGGFVRMDTGDAARPWVRTFANGRLGLPNLARHLSGHDQAAATFQLFAGILGYLRAMGETFEAGDVIDLGDGPKLNLRAPAETEWFLDSDGPMLVIEG